MTTNINTAPCKTPIPLLSESDVSSSIVALGHSIAMQTNICI